MSFSKTIRYYLLRRDIRRYFDKAFYLGANDDVRADGIDPLRHFILYGWKEGRDPSAEFSTRDYLDAHPELAEQGENPLRHHARRMRRKRRTRARHAPSAGREEEMRIADAIRPDFDDAHYRSQCPDPLPDGVDPVLHYIRSGAGDGLDPNPEFSTRDYLETYPDIAEAAVNPFWHYIVAGRNEGRSPRSPGGYRYRLLRRMQTLPRQIDEWQKGDRPKATLSAADLQKRIRAGLFAGSDQLMVGFGHDNYLKVSGGVQLCIQHEADLARAANIAYLNIHPAVPLPVLARRDTLGALVVRLVLNGTELGLAHWHDVQRAIAVQSAKGTSCRFVIHHLLGLDPEQTADLIKSAGQTECVFWLHDYFSLCPNPALQRNAISYCHAPDPRSAACGICKFGEERPDHLTRIQALFDALDIHLLSPSEVALDIWTHSTRLPVVSTRVVPHLTVEKRPRATPEPETPDPVIRIAFAGSPMPHKGWNEFLTLWREFGASDRFSFHYFGNDPVTEGIERHDVQVTSDNPTAMSDALHRQRIDIVLHWASCPETFSFSTYEALAGGAAVITNTGSGNVARIVRDTDLGMVFDNREDLRGFFAGDGDGDGVARLARQARKHRAAYDYHLRFSDMTLTRPAKEPA